jgi:hypothetical protein
MRILYTKPFVPILGRMLPLFLLFAFVLKAEATTFYPGSETVNQAKQQRWVKKTAKELKKLQPEDCTDQIVPRVVDIEGLFLVSYRVNNNAGCIQFPNGDWIYLVSHSLHDDPAIGDITLAIDNRNRIFSNTGHVCGGIINFYIDTNIEIQRAQDFFDSFMSDCDDCKWNEIRL